MKNLTKTSRKALTIVITLLSTIIITLLTTWFVILYGHNLFAYDVSNDYHEQLELKYWKYKDAIIDEMDKYIHDNAPGSDLSAIVVLNGCIEYDIDVRFVLAQGFIESHFGTKGLAVKTNSVWNFGAFDGHSFEKINGVYKYEHPDRSVRPYLKKLRKNYLGTTKTEEDLLMNFVNIDGNRYASSKNYEAELKLKIKDIEASTTLDSLLTEFTKNKLRLNR